MAGINSLKSLNSFSSECSKGDQISVGPHLLLEQEGFNSRGVFCDNYYEQPHVVAHIRALADAYKNGNYVPLMVVRVINGDVFIRDGHCRRRALLLAISEGADIKKIPVLEIKGDEAKQAALIVTSNSGLELSPLERAVIYGRLSAWGYKNSEIAKEVGKTTEHVRQLLALLELPIELKRMIQQKTVAASFALSLYTEHGDEAIELVKSGMEELAAAVTGSEAAPVKMTKARMAKVGTKPAPRMNKKLVESMRSRVSALPLDNLKLTEDGNFLMSLTADEVDALKALKAEVEALREPAAPDAEKQDDNQHPLPIE